MKDKTKKDIRNTSAGLLAGAGVGALANSGLRTDLIANLKKGTDSRWFKRFTGKKVGVDSSFPDAPKEVSEKVDKLITKLKQQKDFGGVGKIRNVTIGIAGASGSGKSTFARELIKKLNKSGKVPEPRSVGSKKRKQDHYVYELPNNIKVKEKTNLFSTLSADDLDVAVRLDAPDKTVKTRLLSRGRGAIQYDAYNLGKMRQTSLREYNAFPGRSLVTDSNFQVKKIEIPKGISGINLDLKLGTGLYYSKKLPLRIGAGALLGGAGAYGVGKLLRNKKKEKRASRHKLRSAKNKL